MQRIYLQQNSLDFKFEQTPNDFKVDEIPLGEFKGNGKYLILLVQKVEVTTWDMVAAFAKFLNIEAQKIGYAGLKDKHATTTQFISLDAKYENSLRKFSHKNIKIIKKYRDTKNIRMGDLGGNRFSINLYNVDNIKAGQIEKAARIIEKEGLANYFGYQRFGRDKDSLDQAKEMISGDLYIKDAKVRNFLVSIYQSYFYNEWLKERVLLSQKENGGKFLLLEGDVFIDSKMKLFTPKNLPFDDFNLHKVLPTGLLCGRDVFRSRAKAREIEKKYDDEFVQYKGYRREAVIFPQNVKFRYDKNASVLNISFELPKGSYATVFLEAIAGKTFSA